MKSAAPNDRRYWLAYPAWIAVCAVLFVSLAHIGSPTRHSDRIDDDRATVLALAQLRALDRARFADYEVVHVTYARRGEAANDSRWLILCDAKGRTSLREAVVVELSARDGSTLEIRKMNADEAAIGETIPLRGARR